MTFESIYKDNCPTTVKVLLVGESPPALEKNFFYYAPNADLYNFTKIAFKNVYGEKMEEYKNFPDFFKAKGFFLDDLCHEPINDIKDEYKRENIRLSNIRLLANRINEYKPIAIIGIMKKIQSHIAEAIALSKIEPRHIIYLGYPTHNKRNIENYINGLADIIRKLINEGIVD